MDDILEHSVFSQRTLCRTGGRKSDQPESL